MFSATFNRKLFTEKNASKRRGEQVAEKDFWEISIQPRQFAVLENGRSGFRQKAG